MLIVLNGCFSSGKTTISKSYCEVNDNFVYIDPDQFSSLRPKSLTDPDKSYQYTWNLVFSTMKEVQGAGYNCITQVVYSPGITSLKYPEYYSSLQSIFKDVKVFTIIPPMTMISRNNEKRNDIQYPEEILEKCYINIKENVIGKLINIDKDETIKEIVQKINHDWKQ